MRLRLRNRNRLSARLKRRLRTIAVTSTIVTLLGGIFFLYNFIGKVSEGRAAEKAAMLNPKVEILDGYAGRKKITVNSDLLSNITHSNFPMLVSLRLDELVSVNHGGMISGRDAEDILFTSEDGLTIIPFQIERYEPKTGKLSAWVRLEQLDKDHKSIYLYYGKTDAHSYSTEKTFDKPYELVWHFNRSLQSDGPLALPGEYRGIKDEEGRFAAAKDFLAYGGAHAVFESQSALEFKDNITVSAWVKASKRPFDQVITSNISFNGGFSLWLDRNGRPVFEIVSKNGHIHSLEKVDGGTRLEDKEWYKITGVYSAEEDSLKIFVNGKLDRSSFVDKSYSPGGNITIGATSSGKKGFYNGIIDELRISSIAQSADFIKLEFETENDPESFFSIDGQEVFSASPRLAKISHVESEVNEQHVTLRWQSEFERNLDYYTLERSVTGENFTPIARTLGKGNSDTESNYFIIDPAPVFGTVNYRIRSTSFKGESQVTEMQTIHVSQPQTNLGINRIEPNPFKDKFEVAFNSNADGKIDLKLTSISGNVVYSESIKSKSSEENLFQFYSPKNLRPGIYFLSLQQAKETKTVKLIKQL